MNEVFNLSFKVVPLTSWKSGPKSCTLELYLASYIAPVVRTCMTNILYAYFVTAPNFRIPNYIKFPITLLFALQTTHLVSLSWHVINIWLLWCLWGWTIYSDILWFRYKGHSSSTQCDIGPERYRQCSVDLSYLVQTPSHSSQLTLQYTKYFFKYLSW